MTVGVKYCGGCNPRYDRVGLIRRLERGYPGTAFVPARPGEGCDLLLVVCGCAARCADVTGLEASRTLVLSQGEDEAEAAAALAAL